jgi:predicted permease
VIDVLVKDIRFGLRAMRRQPAFTATVVLSLALGIAPTSATFALINAVVLRPVPVRDAESLRRVIIEGRRGATGFSYPLFREMQQRGVFADLFAFHLMDLDLRSGHRSERVAGQLVSGTYCSSLGAKAFIGRPLTPQDDQNPGMPPVAVLSYQFWSRRFGLDRAVLGSEIVLNGTPFTVVGIFAKSFNGLDPGHPVDVTVPIMMQPVLAPPSRLAGPNAWWSLSVVGRLLPGISEPQAKARLGSVVQTFVAEAGVSPDERQQFFEHVRLEPAAEGLPTLKRQFGKPLVILLAIGSAILLIAFNNTVNVLLARAASRQKEISVRLALGASRGSLLRQFAIESLLLSGCAAMIGFLMAFWAVRGLTKLVPESLLANIPVLEPDAQMLVFTIALAFAVGLVFDIVPAMWAIRLSIASELRRGASNIQGRSGFPIGKALLVCQVALSLCLLNCASLFVRSVRNLNNVDTGFNPDNVLFFTLSTASVTEDDDRIRKDYKQVLERLEQLPGVQTATLCSFTPFRGGDKTRFIAVTGYSATSLQDNIVHVNFVGPEFAKALGLPLIAGRDFSKRDSIAAPRVAVINDVAARHYYGSQNPVGRTISVSGSPLIEIVGVAKDSSYRSLRDGAEPMVYLPFLQSKAVDSEITYSLRTVGNPQAVANVLRREVTAVTETMVLTDLQTFSQQIAESILPERLVAWLSSALGVLGLVLASIGLYGAMSYAIAQRTSEIGVRMALGADKTSVLWLVLREALMLIAIGICLGIPMSLSGMKLASGILFGVKSTDLANMAAAITLLILVATSAGYIPAIRAARLDPVDALREQ